MQIEVFDADGKPAGVVEVPADVLLAARVVERWLREHRAISLHGVMLCDE